MPKENADIEAAFATGSQPPAEERPSVEGEANGPGPAPEAGAPNPAGATATPASGQPGPPPPAACAHCGAPVAPGAERCAGCGVFQPGNDASVIHEGRARLTRADLAARDALMGRLFAERGGRGGREALDIVSQLRIEDFATATIQLGKVTRRLENAGAVSAAGNERKSLVATYMAFSARVERLAAELPEPLPSSRTSTLLPDLEALSVDELIARTSRTLKMLHLLKNARVDDPPADLAVMADASTLSEEAPAPAPTPAAPEPERCPHCKRLQSDCDELRKERPEVWEVICSSHPDVIRQKEERATAVMLRQMRFGNPY